MLMLHICHIYQRFMHKQVLTMGITEQSFTYDHMHTNELHRGSLLEGHQGGVGVRLFHRKCTSRLSQRNYHGLSNLPARHSTPSKYSLKELYELSPYVLRRLIPLITS